MFDLLYFFVLSFISHRLIQTQSVFDCETEKMSGRKIILVVFALLNSSIAVSQFPVLIESAASKKAFNPFPKDFSFGAATAAYQVEGGWKEDGKGPSIWDTITHNHPELIADHSTADTGADSYHFYKKDVAALKRLGVTNFAFNYLLFVDENFQFISVTAPALSFLGRLVENIPVRLDS